MPLVFVSGAARSGKSAWAEKRALSLAAGDTAGQLVYFATARVADAEMARRVAIHKAARKGKGFETIERYTDVGGAVHLIPPSSTVLLECLGTLLANEMFRIGGPADLQAQEVYVRKIFDDVMSLNSHVANLLVVSNDIFSDGITYDEPTEKYRRALGALHVKLAGVASLAVECAAGLAKKMEGVF
jgi:adenosylcobinamide kinase/adenosylcobinamide-phosphate guanylyltransferase